MKWKLDKGFIKSLGLGGLPGMLLALGVALLLIGGAAGTSDGGAMSEEARAAELCSSIEGVGECRVMISYSADDEVSAVAVVCLGAEDISVRSDLTRLICSLYGIGAHRVSILPLGE